MKLAILAILFTLLVSKTKAHGLMTEPPQRGILGGNKFAPRLKNPVSGAPRDVFAHFPAGDKSTTPGAGKRSQERDGNFNWTPFEPLKRGFQWRVGVCGDLKFKTQEHLRGGKYYFDGHISRTFRQGSIVKVGTSIIAHHNGFFEMHVCDVQKCGGEISESCFRRGHCQILRRAKNPVCDSGRSRDCAPIDRNFPGRFYLPCTRNTASGVDIYPEDFARFVLPSRLTCEHCVLHWFWTSANNCNPPGVIEYFEGPDGPKAWGKCKGQAGALGGYTKVQRPCGGRDFPEEYYQCADIRITNDAARSGRGKGGRSKSRTEPGPPSSSSPSRSPSSPEAKKMNKKRGKDEKKRNDRKKEKSGPSPGLSVSSTPSPRVPSSPSKGVKHERAKGKRTAKKNDQNNPFKSIKLFADGRVVRKIFPRDTFKNLKFKKLTFKVITTRSVKSVDFYIDGKKVWTEYTAPYFMFGNSGNSAYYWRTPIIGRRFTLELRADGYRFQVSVKLGK